MNTCTCDTCKHWDLTDDQETDGTRACNSEKIDYFSKGPDVLVVHDAEGYSGFATTGPKFGCVHWEAQ